MILHVHLPYYEDIFSIPSFLGDPILCFGYQEIAQGLPINGAQYESLDHLFSSAGWHVSSIDLFDTRAKLKYDMNLPVPVIEHNRYRTLIDIGSIEHVFDTKQCLENCIRMLAVGGHYLLVTPVNGYFGHGLHVFHPEGLLAALELNGMRVVYLKYSTLDGRPLEDPCQPPDVVIWEDPSVREDILMWAVAIKESSIDQFTCPQQGKWKRVYAQNQQPRRSGLVPSS